MKPGAKRPTEKQPQTALFKDLPVPEVTVMQAGQVRGAPRVHHGQRDQIELRASDPGRCRRRATPSADPTIGEQHLGIPWHRQGPA